jgi:murein DD-endopeptidase MepM/ murein hydrolase activator NlpD
MTLPQIRSGFAISQEATNNLTQIYRDFDNRVPDSGELQFWQDRLATGMTLSQVSASFQSASKYSIDRLNSDGNEGHRHTFKIFRTGNTSIAGQVKFATSNDSATSDVDFSSYSAVRNFAPGQTEDVVYVDSRTDSINEGTERFNVSISKVNNADTITTASTFGQIFNLNAPSGYISQLNSWSDAQWNWAAGDETRITGPYWPGSRDERNYQDQSSVLQVYNDLSNMILGRTFSSSAGYVLDPGYWDDPNAGKLYGWHHGIDIDTPNNTITKVKALVGGTLSLVQNIKGNYFLQVNGDDGRFYQYGHLSSLVKASGRISAGEIIGEVGMSAASNHLHFQVNRTSTRPPGYDKYDQDSVYSWTLNPLKVFWQLRREGKV